ncbi:MAG TPA: hypothetical protein VFB88_06105 [Xanthobacteraceae bacterium]|nr:hypothetical protein [Xanthobacteraceae bacterium]
MAQRPTLRRDLRCGRLLLTARRLPGFTVGLPASSRTGAWRRLRRCDANPGLTAWAQSATLIPLPPGDSMPSPHFINEPEHWRRRAAEARTLADQMSDPQSKQAMLRIATDYDRLATRAEARTKAPS